MIGVNLGSMADENLRRALIVGQGDIAPFFTRPVSLLLTLAILTMIVLQFPLFRRWRVGFGAQLSPRMRRLWPREGEMLWRCPTAGWGARVSRSHGSCSER
jgi:hypothetical protein